MGIIALPENRIPAVAELEATGLMRPWNDPVADAWKALDTDSSTVLVGVDNSEIVSSVMVGFGGHRGWMHYVAVGTDLQGVGPGQTMMQAVERRLRGRGVGGLQLMIPGGGRITRYGASVVGSDTQRRT